MALYETEPNILFIFEHINTAMRANKNEHATADTNIKKSFHYENHYSKIDLPLNSAAMPVNPGKCSKKQSKSSHQDHAALRPLQTMRNLRFEIQ